MKFILMNLGFIFSMAFSKMSHPLSLGFMLMIQTLWISILLGIISKTFWFSYILFITFLGGMLILFIYMTSLSSNEYFKFSIMTMLYSLTLLIIMLLMISKMNLFHLNFFNNSDSMLFSFTMFSNINILNMNKLYNYPNNLITIMLIIYLLITLIIIVKMIDLSYGPMRKNF
uniref:NADH-ubiquinone oxidoreductase chain 6 n=1 Tax=Jellisonia amadoi TaxID=1405014 RepID=U5L3G7_JELAM|nr:NADH dehydrogenase subunit 6 [Jellisonia amadoi]AGW80405.1 NADH dehydrogenase subunit 6 [Jellisonia amadoi]